MKLTTSGLCVAAAFAFAASLGAQTTTSSATRSSSDEVSITGCLERSPSGGFVLNNARMENESRSGATTGTTGTTGTTTGTTSTTTSGTSGTTYGNMSATTASAWTLDGDSSELEKHVGHKVQVTGKEKDHAGTSGTSTTTTTGSTTTTSGTTGTSGTTASASHPSTASRTLDVKSVKMISTSCS